MNANRPTKNERRQQAREAARLHREKQQRVAKRNKLLTQGGIVVGVIAVVTVVALLVADAIKPEGPSPANMATNGVKIGQNFEAELAAAREAEEPPAKPVEPNEDGSANIRLYVDYHCVYCQQFEIENGEQLATWLDKGAITLEIHPISTQDGGSVGARYSSRAANAAACVANYSPNNFFDYHNKLLMERPANSTPGYSNEELFERATALNVDRAEEIKACIQEENYKGWVKRATNLVLQDAALRAPDGSFGTPVFTVNGTRYASEELGNSKEAIAQFLNLAESNTAQVKKMEEEIQSESEARAAAAKDAAEKDADAKDSSDK